MAGFVKIRGIWAGFGHTAISGTDFELWNMLGFAQASRDLGELDGPNGGTAKPRQLRISQCRRGQEDQDNCQYFCGHLGLHLCWMDSVLVGLIRG